MTRAMNSLILTRAHYRRRYGADVPEASVPSRFLEEVPEQLIENLGAGSSRATLSPWRESPAWSTPAYSGRQSAGSDNRHFNYEDESQEVPQASVAPTLSSRRDAPAKGEGGRAPQRSLDNIARFFGGKSAAAPQVPHTWEPRRDSHPAMNLPEPNGASGIRKGQRVFHAKYGEGTVLMREGEGDDAKLTVLFARHGMKKLMEKFANLRKL
jgi:DNA helicase II / ATP-dependent DNA helicase PcrA